jgi:tetratricopeptide (TPR) repeat protein
MAGGLIVMLSQSVRAPLRVTVCLAITALAGACSNAPSPTGAPARGTAAPSLQAVALPDLAAADEGVREQAKAAYATLLQAMQSGAGDNELGNAYGRLAMFLHAAEYFDAALPGYQNAAALQPNDARWPYYMGLLYNTIGRGADAVAAFQRALMLTPDDVPTMIRLAQLLIDEGRPDDAEPLLIRASTQEPRSVPVLAALGQVALARGQYQAAVRHFEAALAIDPGALSLHAPLANAYRALGHPETAGAHLKQWRNLEIIVADPRREALDLVLRSGLSYELRGLKAMHAQDWKGATAAFREGLTVAPAGSMASRSLHHKLGTALYMGGDPRGAVQQFREVLRSAPAEGPDEWVAKANYSLGVLMMSGGRFDQAVAYLNAAVKYQPNYAEAHLALGDALRRNGKLDAAAKHYREVVRIDPSSTDARFAYAVTLVRLRRYLEARQWLEESLAVQHEQPVLTHALARVLASAPDDHVRDGQRALALAQQLAQQETTTDVGESLAMAVAEPGNYTTAVSVQKDVMAAAARAGLRETVARMGENLRRYERRQPCRTPWAASDPVNLPGPPVTPELTAIADAPVAP